MREEEERRREGVGGLLKCLNRVLREPDRSEFFLDRFGFFFFLFPWPVFYRNWPDSSTSDNSSIFLTFSAI